MSDSKLEPGRELDALVAERVMGRNPNLEPLIRDAPAYSTDIAAAWEVAEKVKRKDIMEYGDFYLVWGNYGADTTPKGPHGQMIYPNALAWFCRIDMPTRTVSATADTAPHAICLAALEAVGDL